MRVSLIGRFDLYLDSVHSDTWRSTVEPDVK